MCGIFGIVTAGVIDPDALVRAELLQRHRGPDAQRRSVERVGQLSVGLAHQRLSIIDLSEAGVQPMRSPSGRSLIIYNGEVYNYRELRRDLRACGVDFRTESDTEVILAACETWGIERALQRMNGMWALCLLDFAANRIVFARDRFGKKPLYFLRGAHGLAFGSEIKTLLRAIPVRTSVNMASVATYLKSSQVDCDEATFFNGVTKLPAGCYAEIDATVDSGAVEIRRYWSLTLPGSVPANLPDAIDEVSALLDDAVQLRLRSDVPVGVLLSGGLDSSAIAAAARQFAGAAPLHAIAAVSDDPNTDESRFSRRVASHLNLSLQEVRLDFDASRLLELIGTVSIQNDEPIGGFSCVAQYLLMQRARDLGVTVLLSGQGADEAFCGYRKYLGFYVLSLLRSGKPIQAASVLAGFLGRGTLLSNLSLAEMSRYLPRVVGTRLPSLLGPATRSHAGPVLGLQTTDVRVRQVADAERFSVPALTHWEDRNSMAWSREVRDPFLDYRLVELGVRLPMQMKLAKGYSKYVLRRAVESRLPREIVWRKDKRGFTTPEALFLRRELRSDVTQLIDGDSLIARTGMVDRAATASRLREFFLNPRGWIGSREIFQLLSLELWLRGYADVIAC